MAVPDEIRELRWRQGSLLSERLADASREYQQPPMECLKGREPCRLIVIGQDCDLLHHSMDTEPWVEVLGAALAGKSDSRLRNLKNPRLLQFDGQNAGGNVLFQANINDRSRIPRELLAEEGPATDILLTSETLSVLVRWLARRYERLALPDTFENRLAQAKFYKDAGKLLANAPFVFKRILLGLDSWDEAPEGNPYRIKVVGTMNSGEYEKPETYRTGEELAVKLEELLGKIPGIELPDGVEFRSEAEISLADFEAYRIWDFESISAMAQDQ